MSKPGDKVHVEGGVSLGRRVAAFSIFLLFVPALGFSKDKIPQVCVPRAIELGILTPSSTATKPAFQKSAYELVPVADKYYHQTLDALNDQIQNDQSPIFTYLMKCANSKNGRDCHHFYSQKFTDPDFYIEKNTFYLDTFCAPQIDQFVVQSAVTSTEKTLDQCSTQAEFIEADDEGEFPENAIQDCFKRETIAGASYWTNQSVEYAKRLEKLRSNTPDEYVRNTVQNSLIPDAADFILRKSKEEFENIKNRDEINEFFHSYYAYADMLSELGALSDGNYLQPDYKVSASNANSLASLIKNKMPVPKFLTFQPKDLVSKELFHQATLNYWKNKTKNQSPLQLSEEEQWDYFTALQADPLLYMDSDSNGFDKLKQDLKGNFQIENAHTGNPYILAGAGSYMASESTHVPFADPIANKQKNTQDFYYRFFGDQNFRTSFITGYSKIETDKFDQFKNSFSPVFLRAFLPYAAARTARTKLLRELKKVKKQDGTKFNVLMENKKYFLYWANQTVCTNWSKAAPAFWCGDQKKDSRYTAFERLFSELHANKSLINNNPEPYSPPSKYLYNDSFVQVLNSNLNNINSYCQQNANPAAYEKNPKQFDTTVLDSMFYKLYSVPQMSDLLDKEAFIKTVQADPANYRDTCFTKGRIFGQDLAYTDEMYKRMHTSKGKGQLVSNTKYGYQGDIYPTAAEASKGLSFQQIYAKPTFKVSKSDMERVEDKIEQALSDEMAEIQEASGFVDVNNHLNVDRAKVQKFLQESTIKRLPAMMDYALDNPSQQLGKLYIRWIEDGSTSEKEWMDTVKCVTNGFLIAGTIIPVLRAPTLAANAGIQAIIYSAGGVAMTFAAVSVGSAMYQLYLYNQRQLLAERASLVGNLFPGQAEYLKKAYDASKKGPYTDIAGALLLTVVFAAKPVMSTMKFASNYLTDSAFQLAWKSRGVELENFTRYAGHETKFQLEKKFTEMIRDKNILSNEEFEELMKSFYKGDYENFLTKNLGSKLEKSNLKLKITSPENRLTPKESYGQKISIELVPAAPTLMQSITNVATYPVRATYNAVANSEAMYSLRGAYMMYIRQNLNPVRWFGLSDKYRFNWEKSLVTFLDKARESKNGAAMFPKDVIDEISPKLRYFEYNNGVFALKSDPNLIEMLGRFNLRGDVYDFLKPALQGELLSKHKIDIILQNFNRPMISIGDAKAFLKAVKYINRDFSGWNVVTKAAVNFSKRNDALLARINDFYDLAKFKKYECVLRFIKFIRENNSTWKYTEDELETIIVKYDRNFNYKIRSSEEYLTKASRYIQENEKKLAAAMKDPDLKPFLEEESLVNNNFHNDLKADLSKGRNFETAFSNAIDKTRVYKNVHNECSLPNSVARKKIDRQYVNYALGISIASSFLSYMWHHYDEDKNREWYTRILYDMAVPTVLSRWQALKFTGGGQTILSQILVIPMTSLKVFSADAVGYNYLTNGGAWGVWDNQKNQSEFARQLYQSGSVEQMTENFLADHPEIGQEIEARGKKLEAIFAKFQDRDIEGIPDDQIISEFVNSELIEEYTYEGMKKEDDEQGENYVYHELLKNNVITPDMFPDPSEDSQEQLLQAIKDIKYNDLYESKNTKVNLPIFGQVDIGDWWEIDSKDRAILDQSPLSPEATDRFVFNMIETTATAPFVFARSRWVYSVLCRQRFLPGKLGLLSPLLIHAAYKSVFEPAKYVARDQMTGH